MVYVLSSSGEPLMPTSNGKARILLRDSKAKVVEVTPFTIQLLYETTSYVQPVTLGIDSGYQYIGFSAVTEKKELISGEVTLLSEMKRRIADKAIYRRQRRNRKRYRAPRFNNRKRKESWLAPSIQHKLDSHERFINRIKKFLPISKIIIEVASFDIQKIKNPEIQGKEYQHGEQMGFWNLREYILYRDHHTCQNPNCKNTSASPILEIHHITFQSNGGSDTPNNLITLCTKCHTSANHKKGKFLYDWQTKRPVLKTFRAETFMSTVRLRLKKLFDCDITYGYITKNRRIRLGLEKTHYNDAFCIAGGSDQSRINPIYYTQFRRNNRRLTKFRDAVYIDIRTGEKAKGAELCSGRRTRNKLHNDENLRVYRGRKISSGQTLTRKQRYLFQPNDLVLYDGNVYTSGGTHNRGNSVVIRELGRSISPKKLIHYRHVQGIAWTKAQ